MNAPCYKCEDREVGCQGVCKKYKEFRDNLNETNEKRRKYIAGVTAYIDFKKCTTYKNMKRGR